jgi:putative flippase GtrA
MSMSLQSLMPGATFEQRRPTVAYELVAFLLVGGVAALAFVVLSTVMIELPIGLPDWIVSAVCYAIFIVPVYLMHRRYSFRSDIPHRVGLPRYLAVQFSALLLASLFSYLCYSILSLQSALAAALVISLTAGVNFAVLRLWAFARR